MISKKLPLLVMFGIWLIDYSITVTALNFREGFSEANPIARYFFNHGIIGTTLLPLFILLVISFLLFIVQDFSKVLFKFLMKKEMKKEMETSLLILAVLIFIIGETFVILHNIFLLL